MRKLLFSVLLASVAASPALADRPDRADRDQARAEQKQDRQQAREERQQVREERQQSVREERVDRPQNFARPQNFERQAPQQVNDYAARGDRQQVRDQRAFERDQRADQRVDNRQQRIDERQLRQSNRQYPNVVRTRPPVVSYAPQPGTQPPLRYDNHRNSPVQWNTTWRNNSRYDWRGWRNRHRNTFHLGFYYDPFGWGYQRYSIGYRLWPAFYGRNFWINDPWQYRLPYAPPGTQWVRYYDDALLVDMYSGQVVDVIYDFFW